MKRRTTVQRILKILFLVVVLEETVAETTKNEGDGGRNRSIDNRLPTQGPYLSLKNGIGRTKPPFADRELFRKNYQNRSDFEKKFQKKEEKQEEEFFQKANRDALISKPSDRVFHREENFDSFNLKILNSRGEGEERMTGNTFRRDDSYAPNRHPVLEGIDDYLSPSRQKKMKKHGGSSFLPFSPARERKPNIILVLTDDQDVELGSLNFMPKTLRLLRDGGAEFRHAYVTTPMCCPSRSSLLTGMYVHNHNVFTNNENCSNIQWQQTHETRTFATYLSNAGYRTGYFGKYLNKYNGSYIPPGWREWGGLIMNSRYYNYSINLNGKKIKHGFDYHKDYYPDLIANDSIAFLRQSKQYFSRKPVMLVVSFPAPHGPEDSAPQFSKMFFNITTHHTPSYDFAPNPDKQWILQVTNKMQDIHKQFTDVLMTKRLQTLQSVDAAVERIYQELKSIGELDNTYIIYTSDHGYHLGQFGLVKGKSFPFEFDVRVPFLVRGPGIEPGTVVDDIVLNIDLAPTFLDLAGVDSPSHMDGRSIVRLLHHRPTKRRRLKWPDTFLIESSGRREIPDSNPEAKRLREEKLKMKEARLLRGKGLAVEDVEVDTQNLDTKVTTKIMSPDSSEIEVDEVEEEENSEEDNRSTPFAHEIRFEGFSMAANSYTQVDNKIPQIAPPINHPIPKLTRLALECQNPGMRTPCQPGQKWHCIPDGDRWRKYKCKFPKKCTCFTPTGIVYTRLHNEDRGGILGGKFGSRKKRSSEIWAQVPETIAQAALLSLMSRSSKVMSRKKRETTEDHLTDVLDDLEQELVEAEETESSINATFTLGQEPNITRCSVTTQGKVNCSSLIYSDFKVWKKSRDDIEAKIRNLKIELEALKEIRKHLREKRPETGSTPSDSSSATTTFTAITASEESKSESFFENYTPDPDIKTELHFSTLAYFAEESVGTSSVTEENHFYSTTGIENFSTTIQPTGDHTIAHKQKNFSKPKSNEDGSSNRIHGVTTVNRGRDRCICRPDNQQIMSKKEEKELAKEARRKLKEEKLRKKERKLKKKAKLEKECLSEKMNCFIHDNEHWRTPPLWTEGPFCFCMNANNNTYSCLRTINATHNFLYCEFTTGFKTFYNLRIDPFEQLNRISTLTPDESRFLGNQLADLKACKGTKECTMGSAKDNFGYHHPHQHQHHTYPPRLKSDITY